MRCSSCMHKTSRALRSMFAMMADPSFAEHLLPEAALPLAAVVTPIDKLAVAFGFVVERVGSGSQPNDWLASVNVIDNVLHLWSGNSRKRVAMIMRSALANFSSPGMLLE